MTYHNGLKTYINVLNQGGYDGSYIWYNYRGRLSGDADRMHLVVWHIFCQVGLNPTDNTS